MRLLSATVIIGLVAYASADALSGIRKVVGDVAEPSDMSRTKMKGADAEIFNPQGTNKQIYARHGMTMGSNNEYSQNQQHQLKTEKDKATIKTRGGKDLTAKSDGDVKNAVGPKSNAASLSILDKEKGYESGSVNAADFGGQMLGDTNGGAKTADLTSINNRNGKQHKVDAKSSGERDWTADADGGNKWMLDSQKSSNTGSQFKDAGIIDRADKKSGFATKSYLYEVEDAKGSGAEHIEFSQDKKSTPNAKEWECTRDGQGSGSRSTVVSVCKRTDDKAGQAKYYYRTETTEQKNTKVYKIDYATNREQLVYHSVKFIDKEKNKHSLINPKEECIDVTNGRIMTERSGCQKGPYATYHTVAKPTVWQNCEGATYTKGSCTTRSCPVGDNEVKIIEDTCEAKVSGDNGGNSVTITFPDCWTVECDAMLGKNVKAEQIAVEFIADIMPMGRLKCEDENTCGRECYYCNLCQQAEKESEFKNVDVGEACEAQGGKSRIKGTFCPPPDGEKFDQCGGFSKNSADYWTKEGAVSTQIRVYVRPPCEVELVKRFQKIYDNQENPAFSNFAWNVAAFTLRNYFETGRKKVNTLYRAEKLGLLSGGKLNVLQFGLNAAKINEEAPKEELHEWFVRSNGNKYLKLGINNCNEGEKISACRQAVQDYSLTGNSGKLKNSNWLLDASSAAFSRSKSGNCAAHDAGYESRADAVLSS